MAQPGSAHVWGAWGRKFESCLPDKTIKALAIARVFYFVALRARSQMRKNKKPVAGDNRQGFNCFDHPLLRSPQVILLLKRNIISVNEDTNQGLAGDNRQGFNCFDHPLLRSPQVILLLKRNIISVRNDTNRGVAGDNRQGFNCFNHPLLRSPQVILLLKRNIISVNEDTNQGKNP